MEPAAVSVSGPLNYVMDVVCQTRDVWGSPPLLAVQDIPGIKAWQLPDGFTHVAIPANAWDLLETRQMLDFLQLTEKAQQACARVLQPLPRLWDDAVETDYRLRPYQRDGVRFLLQNRQALLGDQMGLGKTRTAAIAASFARMLLNPARPVVIIGPRALASTWRAELEKINAEGRFLECGSLNPNGWWQSQWGGIMGVHHAAWLFIHYEILDAWQYFLSCLSPAVVILDEAHLVKNSRTKRGKAVWSALVNVPYRFLLTGTPIENRPGEIWHLLQLATGEWTWGSLGRFRMRYAGAARDDYGLKDGDRPTHVEEFRRRVKRVVLRRTVKDVDLDLPPLVRDRVEVDLDVSERRQYMDVFDGWDPVHIFNALRERRMSTDTLKLFNKARQLSSELKKKRTVEEMTAIAEQGEDVVVFCWQKKTATQLAAATRKAFASQARGTYVVHGDRKPEEREQAIEHWREGGGALVATYGTLGVGVNLQRARFVIIHDLEWKPSLMLQAEARVWRGGQTRAVNSKWVVGRGMLDDIISKLVMKKAVFIEQFADDDQPATLGEVFNDEDDLVQQWVELWRTWKEAA